MSQDQRQFFADAQSHLRAGDMAAAISVAETGLATFPEDGNLMCIAARAAIALGRIDDARL